MSGVVSGYRARGGGRTSALVKELHGVLGDGQEVSNVLVSSEYLDKCVAIRFKRKP